MPGFIHIITAICCLFTAVVSGEDRYGVLPLGFEENRGQTDPSVRFLARGAGYTIFLTDREAVLRLHRTASLRDWKSNATNRRKAHVSQAELNPNDVIRTRLIGAAQNPPIRATGRMPGDSNYFIGSDSTKWQSDIPNYSHVRFSGVSGHRSRLLRQPTRDRVRFPRWAGRGPLPYSDHVRGCGGHCH